MVIFFFKKLFICVILLLFTKFQSPTMPGTRQKVCVRCGGVVWWCKPIIVFSLDQAEQ